MFEARLVKVIGKALLEKQRRKAKKRQEDTMSVSRQEKREKSMCGTYWRPKKWHKLDQSVYNQKTDNILKSGEGRTRNLVRRLKS